MQERLPSVQPLATSRDVDAELKVWADLLRHIVEFGSQLSERELESPDSDRPARIGGSEGTTRVAIFRLSADEGLLRCVANSGGVV